MIRTSDLQQDRLYLSQGEDNIYIDTCKIPSHHIDGIRFLYRQWKRKRPGVIINDPFSFGRNIQIILFLKAVLRFLDKPVLILCQAGTEHNWMDRFNTWADLLDDLVIEIRNPMVRKKIIVNTTVNLPLFCRRDWSVLIVDADKDLSANQVLKLPFRADFKIWNTPINMKENLDRFAEIYYWLYPNEIFARDYFTPNVESAVDVIEKAILLDSFMEDIVLRRDDLNSSFEEYQREIEMPQPQYTAVTNTNMGVPQTQATSISNINVELLNPQATNLLNTKLDIPLPPAPPAPPTTLSKKNKDATGTKIKRSKRKPDEQESGPPTAVVAQPIGESSKPCTITTEDFSIDNYKRKIKKDNEELLDKEEESQSTKIINIDDPDHQNFKLYYDSDSLTGTEKDNLVEMDTLMFGQDLLIRKINTKDDKLITCDKKGTAPEPAKVLMFKPTSEPTPTKLTETQSHTKKVPHKKSSDNIANESLYKTKGNVDTINKETYKSHKTELKLGAGPNDRKQNRQLTKITHDSDNTSDELKMNLKRKKETSGLGTSKSNEVTKVPKKYQNIKMNETQRVKVNCEVKVKTNEPNIQIKVTGTKHRSTEQVNKSLKHINIDEEMKECEQKVSKKFKGSILDSLF